MASSAMHTDGTKQGQELPSATASEREIKKWAPNALRTLKQLDAEDCIDILGLRPHVKKGIR